MFGYYTWSEIEICLAEELRRLFPQSHGCKKQPTSNALPQPTYKRQPTSNALPQLTYKKQPTSNALPQPTYKRQPTSNALPQLTYKKQPTSNALPQPTYKKQPTSNALPQPTYKKQPTSNAMPQLTYKRQPTSNALPQLTEAGKPVISYGISDSVATQLEEGALIEVICSDEITGSIGVDEVMPVLDVIIPPGCRTTDVTIPPGCRTTDVTIPPVCRTTDVLARMHISYKMIKSYCPAKRRYFSKLIDSLGHRYSLKHVGKTGGRMWRCDRRSKPHDCPATVKQIENMFRPGKLPHDHPPLTNPEALPQAPETNPEALPQAPQTNPEALPPETNPEALPSETNPEALPKAPETLVRVSTLDNNSTTALVDLVKNNSMSLEDFEVGANLGLGTIDSHTSVLGVMDSQTSALGLMDSPTSALGLIDSQTSALAVMDSQTSALAVMDSQTSTVDVNDINTPAVGTLPPMNIIGSDFHGMSYMLVSRASNVGRDILMSSDGHMYSLRDTRNDCTFWRCMVRRKNLQCAGSVRQYGEFFLLAHLHIHEAERKYNFPFPLVAAETPSNDDDVLYRVVPKSRVIGGKMLLGSDGGRYLLRSHGEHGTVWYCGERRNTYCSATVIQTDNTFTAGTRPHNHVLFWAKPQGKRKKSAKTQLTPAHHSMEPGLHMNKNSAVESQNIASTRDNIASISGNIASISGNIASMTDAIACTTETEDHTYTTVYLPDFKSLPVILDT